MLAKLNSYWREDNNFTICYTSDGEIQDCELFRSGVFNLAVTIASRPEKNWLLYEEDPFKFIQGFFALQLLKRKVIICANGAPAWLALIADEFDAVLSDTLRVEGKSLQRITCVGPKEVLASSTLVPTPCLDGTESLVFFTSGSTGKPKAIHKCLAVLLNEVETLENLFGPTLKNSCVLSSVSHNHIYGFLFGLLWPMLSQRCWINRRIEFHEQLVEIHCDQLEELVFISSPAFLSRLDNRMLVGSVSACFSSGGPLSYRSARASKQCFGQLPVEVYGSTETGGIGYRQQRTPDTMWCPFPGIELAILKGKANLRSPYVLDAAGNAVPTLLDDRIEIGTCGSFQLLGRYDRVVKVEEKRISLDEIEQYLESFDTIERCVITQVPGKRQVLGCAYVLSKEGVLQLHAEGSQAQVKAWKIHMRQRFEAVTIPRKWRRLAEIPVNTQNKINMSAVQQYFHSSSTAKQ